MCIPAVFAEEQPQLALRPKIVFIMLDDMDYDDVGVYGSPDIQTPAMDAVAAQGMRFTQYYTNGPVCSPTRAAILTGNFPSRYNMDRIVTPTSYRGIPADVPFIAQVLRNAGYYTAHIGKWHVGTSRPEFLPTRRGFDYSVRHIVHDKIHDMSYFDFLLSYNDKPPVRFASGSFLTETLTDEALEFMRASERHQPGKPFFLNLWYHAPHEPLEVPYDFDNSQTHYCIDYDLANLACDSPRGTFAALVTSTDQQIQRILDEIDGLGLADNTLVIITSDNGGVYRTHSKALLPDRPLRGYKDGVFDGGLRVPFIARWPGVIPEGAVNRSVIASFDLFPTLARIAGADPNALQVDGESFSSVLRTNRLKQRTGAQFWATKFHDYSFRNSSGVTDTYAVGAGDWKLVYVPASHVNLADRVMLFNMKKDPAETHDLLAAPAPENQLRLRLFGEDIFGSDEPSSPTAPSYQVIVANLQNKYYRWRHQMEDITYQPMPSAAGVAVNGDALAFDGGVATVAGDVRFDVNDGAFSFLTRITPLETDSPSVVAEKDGSWRLLVADDALRLVAYGPADGKVELSSPIEAGREYHVAFTLTSWGFHGGKTKVRLFIDGKLTDESINSQSIRAIRAVDVPGESMIFIGNNRDQNMPFHGEILKPRMSVLGLYPAEVRLDYADVAGMPLY